MEGKKVLWVVFSVTLVLVVVLAAGLFLLRPKSPKATEAAGREPPSVQGYDAFEYVRGTSATPGLAPAPAQPPQQVTIVVGEQPGQAPPAVAPQPAPALQPESAPAQAPAPAPRIEAPPVQPAPAPAAKPVAKPAPKQVRVTEYWIQTGSYSSASRADEVVRALADKGLASKTSTRQLDGKTHFRVRIGPYASKAEADKFLAWIQDLKGFEGSYISMVNARRTIP
jgi:cell division protein FtsN